MPNQSVAGFPALVVEGRPDLPRVLLLHGAFVTHTCFAGWVDALSRRGFACVAPSRRGRLGLGPADAAGLRFADYWQDTERVLDEVGDDCVVVGHSLGALLAQKVAAAGRCRAAVLLSPAPPAMLTAQPRALPAYATMLGRIIAGQPVKPSCDACSALALNRVPAPERAAHHAALVHESGAVYRELMFGAVRVDAAAVRCPVLVVSGRDDRIISPALARATARRYATTARILDGHGHWLLAEPGWERVVDDVAGFAAAAAAAPAVRAS